MKNIDIILNGTMKIADGQIATLMKCMIKNLERVPYAYLTVQTGLYGLGRACRTV